MTDTYFATLQEGNQRLLELAGLLEDVPAAHREDTECGPGIRGYAQRSITHECGAPACAWGHWVLSTPERLERTLIFSRHGFGGRKAAPVVQPNGNSKFISIPTIEAADPEFHLTQDEVMELFNTRGCGGAMTGAEAAAYIRAFVARRSTHNEQA